jgi:hypothetical protein
MPATQTPATALETYHSARAARTGVAAPSMFHVSFNIGGRVVSDKVRGYMGAVARLDLLVEQSEAEEFQRTRKIVLARNCKVREVAEFDDLTRAMAHEFAARSRIKRWGC